MQLQVVSIEDVYPDKNNPRKTFEGIDELAASFDLNSERPGEPFTPPILVQDGGIYRIIDGERRYRALKKRKATSFTANVCTDMDEANTVMAMLATDDKQPLSELEKSQGVQTMLLLGVDPVKVEKAAKIKGAKRAKRAMEIVDDAAQDMTFDRLLAIEEFDGDDEAVEKLTNCSEKEWRNIYNNIKYAREKAEHLMQIEAKLRELDIPIFAEKPEGYSYAGYTCTPDNAIFDVISPEECVARKSTDGFFIYEKDDDSESYSEQEEERDTRRAKHDVAIESREKFFCDRWPDNLPNFTTVAMNSVEKEDSKLNYRLSSFLEAHDLEFVSPALESLNLFVATRNKLLDFNGEITEEGAEEFVVTTDFLKCDGYIPPQEELDLYDEAKAFLEGGEDETKS